MPNNRACTSLKLTQSEGRMWQETRGRIREIPPGSYAIPLRLTQSSSPAATSFSAAGSFSYMTIAKGGSPQTLRGLRLKFRPQPSGGYVSIMRPGTDTWSRLPCGPSNGNRDPKRVSHQCSRTFGHTSFDGTVSPRPRQKLPLSRSDCNSLSSTAFIHVARYRPGGCECLCDDRMFSASVTKIGSQHA